MSNASDNATWSRIHQAVRSDQRSAIAVREPPEGKADESKTAGTSSVTVVTTPTGDPNSLILWGEED